MKKTSSKSKNEAREVDNLLLSQYLQKNQDYITRLRAQMGQMEAKEKRQKKISMDLVKWLQSNLKELKDISENQLQSILSISELISFKEGQKIVKIGDKAEYFYIIVSGYCSVFISIPNQISTKGGYLHLTEVKKLEPMQTFGELGLIHPNGLRSSEIDAKTDCTLIAIPREIYNLNLKDIIMSELNVLWGLIKQVSYINHWYERDIANLIYKLPTKQYCLNQSVYQQGDSSESGIFFVLKGEFEIRRQIEVDGDVGQERNALIDIKTENSAQMKQISVQIAVLSAGCSFGEEEVVLNKKRESNIICISEGAQVYYTTKSEFEKKILWNKKSRDSLNILISQRQQWANQKLQEYKKTLEISKNILHQKNAAKIFSPNSKYEKNFRLNDHELPINKTNRNYENSPSKFLQRINSKSEYTNAHKNIISNEQTQRRQSHQVSGQDQMTLKEALTIDILKDQNKLIGFESQDEDDFHLNQSSFKNVQRIKKEYSFSDQMATLIAENQQNSQKFEAINKDHLDRYSQQTASQFSNISSRNVKNIPQLNQSYKQNEGENVQKFIERMKKSSYAKSIRDEKKSAHQQEIKKEIKEYTQQLIESFEGNNNQNYVASNKEGKKCLNFVDFNFVRTQYNNRKIEEKQTPLKKLDSDYKDKLEQQPIFQRKTEQLQSPFQSQFQDQFTLQQMQPIKNQQNQLNFEEQLDQKSSFTRKRSSINSPSHQQQFISIPLYLQQNDQDFQAKQNEQMSYLRKDECQDKILNKIKSKELKLFLINSPKMFQYYNQQKTVQQNPQSRKNTQVSYTRNSFSLLQNQQQKEQQTQQDSQTNFFQNVKKVSENIPNNQQSINLIKKASNQSDLNNDHNIMRKSAIITNNYQNGSTKILPIIRNHSEMTQKELKYQYQYNEFNILNNMKINESCILQTKATNLFNRNNLINNINNDYNRSQFSQVDEFELNEISKEDQVFSKNYKKTFSEQNSPILNPQPANSINFRRLSQSQRQSFYKKNQNSYQNKNPSFSNIHNAELVQSIYKNIDPSNCNFQLDFSRSLKHFSNNNLKHHQHSLSTDTSQFKNQQKNQFNMQNKKNTYMKNEAQLKNIDQIKQIFNHELIIIDKQQNLRIKNFDTYDKFQNINLQKMEEQNKQKIFVIKRNQYHN